MTITSLYSCWDHNRDFEFSVMTTEENFDLWENTVVSNKGLTLNAYKVNHFYGRGDVEVIPRYEDLWRVLELLDKVFEVEVFNCKNDGQMTVWAKWKKRTEEEIK